MIALKMGRINSKANTYIFGTEQFANWNCVLSYLDCGPFTPSDILQDCLKKSAALVQVENEDQSRVIGALLIAINGKCLIWHVFMWMKQQLNTKRLFNYQSLSQ